MNHVCTLLVGRKAPWLLDCSPWLACSPRVAAKVAQIGRDRVAVFLTKR
jgi:hypothetical protein